MGQLVGVVEKPSATPGVVRFELNRSLTGMGHERFTSMLDAVGPTPSAALARQLFASGRVAAVHVFGNMVTVDIEKGYDSAGLAEIVREMYRYWKPGVEVIGMREVLKTPGISILPVGVTTTPRCQWSSSRARTRCRWSQVCHAALILKTGPGSPCK